MGDNSYKKHTRSESDEDFCSDVGSSYRRLGMKLKIETLPGETFDVEVGEEATIKELKKTIYKSGKVIGAVRIMKGKEVLPDDNTLDEYDISDGYTVKIIIDPEKEVNIEIRNVGFLQMPSFSYKIPNTFTVKALKEMLTAENDMVIPENEFNLAILEDDEIAATFDDEVLPLHYYGVDEGSMLEIVRTVLSCEIENQKGEIMCMSLPVETTVGELRQRLLQVMGKSDQIDNNLLFKFVKIKHVKFDNLSQRCTSYQKLTDNTATIGQATKFYLFVSRFTKQLPNIFIQRYPEIFGIEVGDTVLSVKLRTQEQKDVPTFRVRVVKQSDNMVCLDSDVIDSEQKYKIQICHPLSEKWQ